MLKPMHQEERDYHKRNARRSLGLPENTWEDTCYFMSQQELSLYIKACHEAKDGSEHDTYFEIATRVYNTRFDGGDF